MVMESERPLSGVSILQYTANADSCPNLAVSWPSAKRVRNTGDEAKLKGEENHWEMRRFDS